MFERYKQRARRAIFFARYDAGRLGVQQIESEHLLLGLAREDEPLLTRFLTSGVSSDSIRTQVLVRAQVGEEFPIAVDLPLSQACKHALTSAAEEADRLGDPQIGTEHLLLGLLGVEDCLAAQMLRERGAEIETIRTQLAANPAPPEPADTRQNPLFASLLEKARLGVSARENSSKIGFERYTGRGRRSVFFARYEAGQSGSPTIESGHLLLGALREIGLWYELFLPAPGSLDAIRAAVERDVAHSVRVSSNREGSSIAGSNVDLPLSDETSRALAYAAEEAEQMNQSRIGPEHLLLGLLREQDCLAARLMHARGADLVRARKILGEDFGDYSRVFE
jgi:ATP-dependent Clp protease ATP-binding subunit ClpA